MSCLKYSPCDWNSILSYSCPFSFLISLFLYSLSSSFSHSSPLPRSFHYSLSPSSDTSSLLTGPPDDAWGLGAILVALKPRVSLGTGTLNNMLDSVSGPMLTSGPQPGPPFVPPSFNHSPPLLPLRTTSGLFWKESRTYDLSSETSNIQFPSLTQPPQGQAKVCPL